MQIRAVVSAAKVAGWVRALRMEDSIVFSCVGDAGPLHFLDFPLFRAGFWGMMML